jgi:predicted RNA-binding protein with PUA-like domain
MNYWLMKSEPDEISIDDVLKMKSVPWFGVRNYQARNFMRDAMRIGDGVLFYHSSCAQPGIAGIAEVSSTATLTILSSTKRVSIMIRKQAEKILVG